MNQKESKSHNEQNRINEIDVKDFFINYEVVLVNGT